MLTISEIPVAYSMIALAKQSARIIPQPFPEFMCYWVAFNNIYTTIAEYKGYSVSLRTQRDGTVRTRENGGVFIPEVEMALTERAEINLAFDEFSEVLQRRLISHPSTEFFIERVPRWQGREIKFDETGQRLNGVINVRYTIDEKHPVWSPVDIAAYQRYIRGAATSEDIYLLSRQLVFLIYTVRNNAFHGGKRADDAIDTEVVEMALPLLKIIVESFIS